MSNKEMPYAVIEGPHEAQPCLTSKGSIVGSCVDRQNGLVHPRGWVGDPGELVGKSQEPARKQPASKGLTHEEPFTPELLRSGALLKAVTPGRGHLNDVSSPSLLPGSSLFWWIEPEICALPWGSGRRRFHLIAWSHRGRRGLPREDKGPFPAGTCD